jgi:hypothetical protein
MWAQLAVAHRETAHTAMARKEVREKVMVKTDQPAMRWNAPSPAPLRCTGRICK